MKEGVRSPDKLFLHLIDIKQIKDTFLPVIYSFKIVAEYKLKI